MGFNQQLTLHEQDITRAMFICITASAAYLHVTDLIPICKNKADIANLILSTPLSLGHIANIARTVQLLTHNKACIKINPVVALVLTWMIDHPTQTISLQSMACLTD